MPPFIFGGNFFSICVAMDMSRLVIPPASCETSAELHVVVADIDVWMVLSLLGKSCDAVNKVHCLDKVAERPVADEFAVVDLPLGNLEQKRSQLFFG